MLGNFPACLTVTLEHEGGWADHPKDPGGATMKGVTLATFRRFYGAGATKAQLKAITREQLERIYRAGYWEPVKGDTLDAGVDLATFDYGVNSGPATARKQLLKVVGGTAAQTVRKLCARRLSIYQGLKHWKTFGKGWTRRIAAIEAKGVAWAIAAAGAVAPADDLAAEADKAKKKAGQQTTGAGGAAAGSGGAAVAPSDATVDQFIGNDQVAAWILAGVVVAGVAIAAWLLWRAHVNRQRAAAYRAEASTEEASSGAATRGNQK